MMDGSAAKNSPAAPTILLVDDEDALRRLLQIVLGQQGFHVLTAADGLEGLELGRQHPGPIDLLITDLVLSGMNGLALADTMRATHPSLKVLYVSGYTDDALMPSGFFEASGAFLQKPFTAVALARKVRGVLD